jgi:hypothetical protein
LEEEENGSALFAAWVQALAFRKIPHWVVVFETVASTIPQEPQAYSPTRLDLEASFSTLPSVASYLPRNIACLTHLTLSLYMSHHFAREPVDVFVAALAQNQLQSLSLTIAHDPLGGVNGAQHYTSIQRRCPLSLAFFAAFPSLRTLRLRGASALSVKRLTLLADSSPFLSDLNLEGSVWDFGVSDFEVDGSGNSRGERLLIETINRLSKLQHLHLGILPFYESEVAPSFLIVCMEQYCSRKIDMKVQGLGDDLSDEEW